LEFNILLEIEIQIEKMSKWERTTIFRSQLPHNNNTCSLFQKGQVDIVRSQKEKMHRTSPNHTKIAQKATTTTR